MKGERDKGECDGAGDKRRDACGEPPDEQPGRDEQQGTGNARAGVQAKRQPPPPAPG